MPTEPLAERHRGSREDEQPVSAVFRSVTLSRDRSSSPRPSVASTNAQSLKDFRKGYQGSSDNLFARPGHRPSSPRRLSVIQMDGGHGGFRRPSKSGLPSDRRPSKPGLSSDLMDPGGSSRPSSRPSLFLRRASISDAPSISHSIAGSFPRATSIVSSAGRGSVASTNMSFTAKSCKSSFSAGNLDRERPTAGSSSARSPELLKSLSAHESQGSSSSPSYTARIHSIEARSRRGSATSSFWNMERKLDAERVGECESVAARASAAVRLKLVIVQSLRRKAAPYCRSVNKNRLFQMTMFGALLCALFLPDMWVILDRPNNDDLDGILSFVLLLFLVELVVQSIGLTRTYWASFFFWMDLLGAVSLLVDLSYLGLTTQSLGESGSNTVILRAARVAKLGARAGRFTRLAKLLRFLPGMKALQGTDQGTAKVISARLISSLSMRVSLLIIVMVVVTPLFSMWTYPGQDWSMRSWLDILEAALASPHPEAFGEQLRLFGAFYDDLGYYPYRLRAAEGAQLPDTAWAVLPWEAARGPPGRAANSVRHGSRSLVCEFNFKKPNQIDSIMNMLLLFVIILLMVGFSLMLSNFVSAQVLRPLEKLLMQVRKMVAAIFQSVSDMAVNAPSDGGYEESQDDEDGGEDELDNETELLERVVGKLALLSQIAMAKHGVDADEMATLGEGDRAVLRGFQGQGAESSTEFSQAEFEEMDHEAVRSASKAMLESAGLSLDLINSDGLNPLELDKARNQAAAMYFVGQQHHGMPVDPVVMRQFLETAEEGYIKTTPYHSWFHAVDVAHCLYRLLTLCSAELYLSGTDRFGLLVSAVCHDIGHIGVTNVYLVETCHDLALRYNDKSPLENMHCARLFELVSLSRCNVFGCLSKHQFQEVRQVCIEAILHTDNAQHFVMIKEIQMFYEVHSEILEAMRESNELLEEFTPTRDAIESFKQPESHKMLVKIFLHLADISNCMKPFRICKIWAMKVLDEFFMQGDLEKKMGLPVQALNDRDKVNKPFSQIGFIEFLVSPFVLVVVRVLTPVELYAEQMMSNMKKWHLCWLADTTPQPSEADQKVVADRIIKLSNKFAGVTHL